MKDYAKAASCYKKACELDPSNVGYRRNYDLTVSNIHRMNTQSVPVPPPNMPPGAVPPNFMETAARLMTDPEVSSV